MKGYIYNKEKIIVDIIEDVIECSEDNIKGKFQQIKGINLNKFNYIVSSKNLSIGECIKDIKDERESVISVEEENKILKEKLNKILKFIEDNNVIKG